MSVPNMARLAFAMMALFFVFSMFQYIETLQQFVVLQYIETLEQFVTMNHLKYLNTWQVTYFFNGL